MMTVHVLATTDDDGTATLAGEVFSGRSAALFAVLAGVGLALLTGGPTPEQSAQRLTRDRVMIAVRAGLILLIGLAIAVFPHGVAIILVHYGLMFFLALPFLRLGARALFVLAAAWAAVMPVLYRWAMQSLRDTADLQPERLWHSPSYLDLGNPVVLALDLGVTGYYPLMLWPAYLFFGMAVGRLRLTRLSVQLWLLVGGAVVAAGTELVGQLVVARSGLVANLSELSGWQPSRVEGALDSGDHMLPMVLDERWFWIVTPHQGSPVELVHSMGTSAVVIGLMLLVARIPWVLAPLAGAGAMPLSLYVGHLLVLSLWRDPAAPLGFIDPVTLWVGFIAAFLVLGTVKVMLGRRGPLEALLHSAGASVAGPRR